jgi:hypothetical protein
MAESVGDGDGDGEVPYDAGDMVEDQVLVRDGYRIGSRYWTNSSCSDCSSRYFCMAMSASWQESVELGVAEIMVGDG